MLETDSVKRKANLVLAVGFAAFGILVLFLFLPESVYLSIVEKNIDFNDELSEGEAISVSQANASLEFDTSGEVWENEITEEFGQDTGTYYRKHREDNSTYLEVYHIGSSSVDLGNIESISVKNETVYVFYTRESTFERTADMNYRGKAYKLETNQEPDQIELAEHTYRDELLPNLLRESPATILDGRWDGEKEYHTLE